jgi:hypothetical protein
VSDPDDLVSISVSKNERGVVRAGRSGRIGIEVVDIERPGADGVLERHHDGLDHPACTPGAAEQCLRECNVKNRPISEEQVNYLARTIDNGEYLFTGETFIFDRAGNTIYCQHRGRACVKTGTPIPALICYGVDPRAFEVVDLNRRRSLNQHLSMDGFKNTGALAAATTLVYSFFKKGALNKRLNPTPTISELHDMFRQHPGLLTASVPPGSKLSLFASSGIPIALSYLTDRVDQEASREFWTAFLTHSVPSEGRWSAPHAMYRRLLNVDTVLSLANWIGRLSTLLSGSRKRLVGDSGVRFVGVIPGLCLVACLTTRLESSIVLITGR